jgi:hypothetical protein
MSEQSGALCSQQPMNLSGGVRYLSISVGGAVHGVRLWAAASVTICMLFSAPTLPPHKPSGRQSRAAIDFGVCLGRESIYDRPLNWAFEAGAAKVATRGTASKTVLRVSRCQNPCYRFQQIPAHGRRPAH